MIKFEKIRFKNILSFGNKFTEINLNTTEIILISGVNGSGKSSIATDVLYFAISGKPYRNIKLNNLINSVNKKNLLVELYFSKNGKQYKVIRGLNPKVFKIYENDKLIEESSTLADYQTVLEQILGFTAKAFKQSFIMSSRYYKPFLELSKSERQEFIENIFDINVFKYMKNLANEKKLTLKRKTEDTELKLEYTKKKKKEIQQLIEKQKQQYDEFITKKEEEWAELEKDIQKIENIQKTKMVVLKEYEKRLEELNKQKNDLSETVNLEQEIQKKIQKAYKGVEFFEKNNICPMCKQEIQKSLKKQKIQQFQEKITKLLEQAEEIHKAKRKYEYVLADIEEVNRKISKLNDEMIKQNAEIQHKKKQIKRIEKEIKELIELKGKKTENLHKVEEEIQKLQEKLSKQKRFFTLYEDIVKDLSEKGIKQYIIQKYIGYLNGFINKYLEIFGSDYRVKFDEAFNIEIFGRNSSQYEYGNLSSGEKQRLDMSLLFAFLELSRVKNSITSNLLILDEIMDNSLDTEGVQAMFKILNILKDKGYTIFVVSHRQEFNELYDKVIKVEKKIFSEIKFEKE